MASGLWALQVLGPWIGSLLPRGAGEGVVGTGPGRVSYCSGRPVPSWSVALCRRCSPSKLMP